MRTSSEFNNRFTGSDRCQHAKLCYRRWMPKRHSRLLSSSPFSWLILSPPNGTQHCTTTHDYNTNSAHLCVIAQVRSQKRGSSGTVLPAPSLTCAAHR